MHMPGCGTGNAGVLWRRSPPTAPHTPPPSRLDIAEALLCPLSLPLHATPLPEKEHCCAGVVQLIHCVEVRHLTDVHQEHHSKVLDVVSS